MGQAFYMNGKPYTTAEELKKIQAEAITGVEKKKAAVAKGEANIKAAAKEAEAKKEEVKEEVKAEVKEEVKEEKAKAKK